MDGDSAPNLAQMRAALAEAEEAEAEARAAAEVARDRAAALRDEDQPVGSRRTLGLAAAFLLTAGALTLTALMVWQHGRVVAQREQEQRCIDAARDGIVALLSIDHTHAKADVQRILDLSTGRFHDDFSQSADDFVKTAETAKTVSVGTVKVAALDSANVDGGIVLIAATSEVTNANGARRDPRPFRMSVTVSCESGTCKMSDVEFVP